MISSDNSKWFSNFNENAINKFENTRHKHDKKMLFMSLKTHKGHYTLFHSKYQVLTI